MTSDIAELVRTFEDHAIDAANFRHADHVEVAHAMLATYDFMDATLRYARAIDAIATKAGAASKFNTTITFAFMSLIAERMGTASHTDYAAFIADNQDLLSKDILSPWYSKERLNCDLARRTFILPDTGSVQA